MSRKTALYICAAAFLCYALFLAFTALSFTPDEGVRAVARSADSGALMTGGDEAGRVSLELLPGELIDINSADSSELQRLPGIGPVLADAIVQYRAANGAFVRVEDIMKVDGIGQGRFDAIACNITVEESSHEDSGG